MIKHAFVLLAALSVSACMQSTPRHWQHKTIPSSQWGSDHNRCKRAADRYLGAKPAYQADQQISDYNEQMRVYNVKKKHGKLVSDCMRKAGYVPMR